MNNPARAFLAATALTLIASSGFAADDVDAISVENAPVASSPWQIRFRALGVVAEDSGYVTGIPGSDLSYSKSVTPEIDISYYFTDNIAAEMIFGTTFANVYGEGSVGALGKIGRVGILSPTLTLQYHFTNFGAFKPYVGAGVNYTTFYNQDAENVARLKVKNYFGGALQVGFDYMLTDNWGVNFDVKKLFLEPNFDATLADGVTNVSGKAELNPWLIGSGVTYRF